jgi:hypothetical protein
MAPEIINMDSSSPYDEKANTPVKGKITGIRLTFGHLGLQPLNWPVLCDV